LLTREHVLAMTPTIFRAAVPDSPHGVVADSRAVCSMRCPGHQGTRNRKCPIGTPGTFSLMKSGDRLQAGRDRPEAPRSYVGRV
jgi:hypothetical protein